MANVVNTIDIISHSQEDSDGGVGHVTLVRPAMVSSIGTWSSPVTPPLGLAYLAAMLLEGGLEVACVDAIAEDIDNIVEELLRRWSVTFSGRVLAQDYEMRGVQMKKGDRITCVLPACNFDPEVFPNPTEVDFDRPRKTILAFTVGVHSCMGGHLARLEIKIALQEWLKRIPKFSLKPGAEIEYRPGGVIGPETLPLVW